MACCACISEEPINDTRGRIKTFQTGNKFQVNMMDAPLADGCTTCIWCAGQFFPLTCGCTQYYLRRRALEDDMSKYVCCQGYVNCCCFRAGSCGEESCPDFCLCVESCLCNGLAVSATRMYVMDKYQLSSDPCDYRLIRINNCIQILACVCDIAAIFNRELRHAAHLIDWLADLVFHTVSGCMTAQVVHELNYQNKHRYSNQRDGPQEALLYPDFSTDAAVVMPHKQFENYQSEE